MIRKIYSFFVSEEENPEVEANRVKMEKIQRDYQRTLYDPPELRKEYVRRMIDCIMISSDKSYAERQDLRIARQLAQKEAKLSKEERSKILREKKNS